MERGRSFLERVLARVGLSPALLERQRNEALGQLEGAFVQGSTAPIVEQEAIDILAPARREKVFLPRESTVDCALPSWPRR